MGYERLPDVSVILPIHGNPIFLRETIKSIEKQIDCLFEIVVILDRAEQWVVDYFAQLRIQDIHISVLDSPKGGIADAINLGIQSARSQMIARIDSDDTMEPDRLISQLNFLLENPDISVVGTQVNFIDSQNHRIKKSRYPISQKSICAILPIRNCIAHPSVMFRKQLFSFGFHYNPEFNGVEDYELWLRVSQEFKIANLPKALTNYRVWEGQVTKTRLEQRSALEVKARNQYIKNLGLPPNNLKARRIVLAATCLNHAINQREKKVWKQAIWGLCAFSFVPVRILRAIISQPKEQKNA